MFPANCGVAAGFPGDTSVAPTLRGARPRRCDGCSGDTSVAPTFWRRHPAPLRRPAGGDERRGAIYDARCRNGTTRPRHCSRRCTRRFRPIAALRRSSGRHKCRPYVGRRHPAALRRPARGDGRRGAIYDARCRNGTPRPRHCARRCTRRFRPIAALRRLFGRHKCRPYVWRRHSAALRRLSGRHKCRPYVGRRHPAPLRRPARGDGRRGAIYDARCRHGTTRPRRCSRRCTRCFRPIAALRRSSGRHKCRPYVAGCSSAALRRLSGRHKCRPYVGRRVWRSRCLPTR